LVVGPVRRIIGSFNFREPVHPDGVDLGDPVLEVGPFGLILYLAITENAFQCDERPLLESLGEQLGRRFEREPNPEGRSGVVG
jgi:hypothetical protein